MAVLKYKDENGQFVTLTNYSVQPIVPVQTTGDSMSDIMSQKAVSDELGKKVNDSDLNEKIASAITNDNGVKDAINSQVSDAISGDNTVKEAVDEAIADAIANASAVTEAVEDVVDEKLTAYTSTEDADLRYAFKEHTHEVSAITGFDGAVAESVKTEITNNNSAITESINSVVEKYIYGEGGASQDAEVVTTDNLDTTLADYAKSEDIPTDLSAFTNSPKYVKESEVNDLVADAIAESETVYNAVTEAITSAITESETVKDAIEGAVSNKADISAVTESINQATSGKVETSDYNTYTAATENALGTKFAGVNYVKDDNKIYFYNNASNTGTALAYVDTADFVVDGMVDDVKVENGKLIIDFNTASGKQDIEIPLTDIFDPSNYYTTGQTDTLLSGKSDIGHTHTANEITDFNAAVSGAVKNNTDVKNEVISAVTASTEFTSLNNTLTAHTADSTVHVTANEKNIWNAKSDFDGAYTSLAGIPSEFTPAAHTHASSDITSMAGYSKPSDASSIATSDTLNAAIGKLEYKIDTAVAGGVSSVSLGSGSTNGSITLSVNGTLQDTITVPGLGGAAYLETGTTAGTVAAGNHTHDYSDVYQAKGDYAAAEHTHAASAITNFASAVENVVSSSTTIETRVESIVASAVTDNASVSGAIETAVESNSAVTASKAVTDFYSGHNTVTSLANIPTDKRLVIATINSSSNELSLSGNTLTDGYEIHVIVKNNGSAEAAVSLPSSGGYVTVGDTIKVAANSTGEINIISDGTSLYVRGA